MERIRLEGTLKITFLLIPCHGHGFQPPHQVAQHSIQPGLGCLHRWRIHNLCEQPVREALHPPSKMFLLTSNPNLSSFSVMPFPLFLSISDHVKCQSPLSYSGMLQGGLSEPFLLQPKQIQLPQPVSIGEVLQPFAHLCSPPLDLLTQLHTPPDRKSTRLNSSHFTQSRMPSSA